MQKVWKLARWKHCRKGHIDCLRKAMLVQKCHASFWDVSQGKLGVRHGSVIIPHYSIFMSLSKMLLGRNSEASGKRDKYFRNHCLWEKKWTASLILFQKGKTESGNSKPFSNRNVVRKTNCFPSLLRPASLIGSERWFKLDGVF